jgi:hypothetical protein
MIVKEQEPYVSWSWGVLVFIKDEVVLEKDCKTPCA